MFSNLFFVLQTITAQASQYPRIIPGSLAIAGTLSSGASASAQSQSVVNVLTRNLPGTTMMHRQGMCITVTMVAVAHAAQYFIGIISYSIHSNMHTFCTPYLHLYR